MKSRSQKNNQTKIVANNQKPKEDDLENNPLDNFSAGAIPDASKSTNTDFKENIELLSLYALERQSKIEKIKPQFLISIPTLFDALKRDNYDPVSIHLCQMRLRNTSKEDDTKHYFLHDLLMTIENKWTILYPDLFFIDIESKYFMPVLLNYLAIIDIKEIKEYLDYYFELFPLQKRIDSVLFLNEHHNYIFSQYLNNDNTQRVLILKDWVENPVMLTRQIRCKMTTLS